MADSPGPTEFEGNVCFYCSKFVFNNIVLAAEAGYAYLLHDNSEAEYCQTTINAESLKKVSQFSQGPRQVRAQEEHATVFLRAQAAAYA